MSVEVESPMKMLSHPPTIMLQSQTTGVGIEPIPLQRIIMNNSYTQDERYAPDPDSDDDDSSSPSPQPSQTEVTYVELNVKPEPDENGTHTQQTYRLLQPSVGMLDARQILQSHGLYEANQAAANYPPSSSGVTTVLLPSDGNLQHSFTHNRNVGELSSGIVYSPHTNGHIPHLTNSASSDSCSSDINSQKPFIYAKPPTSPSPYTANTERARAFNAYVKQLIESRMDCKVPISLQPKHLVDDIMNDAKKHFPEFESCTRKRIRTFLKSCRRSKKFRQQVGDDYIKRSDSASLNMSPALGSSPDLAQIRPQLASTGQTIILPQFITQVPNTSTLIPTRTAVMPHTLNSLSQNNKIPAIPIAQHLPHFNVDDLPITSNISPIHSAAPIEFGIRNTMKSSESDDDMNTGINSEPDNGSTRPSTPHTLHSGSANGSLHSGMQLAQLQNSQNIITSPYLQRPLNGTPTMQIPTHLLPNQGQIINTHPESALSKLSPAALAQVNLVQNRKRPSPTLEDSQKKKINGDVRSSLLHTLPGMPPYQLMTNSTMNGNLGEYPNFPNGTSKLSKSEQLEIQRMIDGYRNSAAFLNKAASQLEKFIQNESSKLS